ncbi:MAG: hypothetical protein ACKORJ_01355 [Bacteroidota bacterium]
MIIYSSPAIELSLSGEPSRFNLTWKPECRFSSEPDLQREFEMILTFMNDHSTKHILSDSLHYPFHGNLEMQNWLDFDFFPRLSNSGVRGFAVVAPPEAVESYRSEKGGLFTEPQQEYFTDHDEANQWLDSLD